MSLDRLLVGTKFAPPRIGTRSVPRKRLLSRLREFEHCKLVLVTGGAGFGKTTLLAQWRQELMKSGDEVAWLSLSGNDSLLPNFCAYLFAALRRLGVAIEDDMLLLPEGASGDAIDGIAAALINAVAKTTRDLFLMVDDYQYVEDPRAHRLVQMLLDQCPENLHWIIASRSVPQLLVSRLRVMGQLAEIECAELPFSVHETLAFLEANLGGKVDADKLRLIYDLTDGWPASVQLVAIVLKNRPDALSSLRTVVHKAGDLQAYLADDVIAHLPSTVADFMEELSIFRRFNAVLAEFVTGNREARDLIDLIEEKNLLIFRVEMDDRYQWYRFHPLLAEFLAERLARRDRSGVVSLHRKASQWFADHGFLVDAVHHAGRANDIGFAVKLIDESAPATWTLGYLSPVLRWLDQLPAEMLAAHPQLFILGCLVFGLTARPAKAEAWIAQFPASHAAKTPEFTRQVALVNAVIALARDDLERVIERAEPLGDAFDAEPFLRYALVAVLSTAYAASGRCAEARNLLRRHAANFQDNVSDTALVAAVGEPFAFLTEGNVREAARRGSDVLARAEAAHGRRSVCASVCAAVIADAFYELDRIDEAREALANRMDMIRFSAPETMLRAALCYAKLELLQHSASAALAFLAKEENRVRELGLERLAAHMLAEQIRILLAGGNRERAAELLRRLHTLAAARCNARGFAAEIPVMAALARARVALHARDTPNALRDLDLVATYARALRRGGLMVQVNLLCGLALEQMNRQDEADEFLREAICAGSQLGLIRTFVDEGSQLRAGLARYDAAALDEGAALHLKEILARWAVPAERAGHCEAAGGAVTQPAVPLTPREVEILGLLAQSMSNKRIALTLNTTLETVKWNLKNVFAKLGVSSRYHAVMWARKHGFVK